MTRLSDSLVVLCQTLYAGNIGSCARALTLMGFSHMTLCQPHCDPLSEEAQQMATFAQDYLRQIPIASSLESCLRPDDFVIGLSARQRDIGPPFCQLPDMIHHLPQNGRRLVLLFGSENHGLTNEELSFCHLQCTIPTFHPQFSSFNLSHAVLLVCYQLAISLKDSALPLPSTNTPLNNHASMEAFEDLLDTMIEQANHSGFCERTTQDRTKRRLKILLNKAIEKTEDRDFLFGFFKALTPSSR